MKPLRAAATLAFALISFAAFAAEFPAPQQREWIARDFKFHTGETMAEVKLGYTTVGEPTGQPVLVLHGTTGNAGAMLTPEVRRRTVRRGPAARRHEILHHHSGLARPRQIDQAVGRAAREIPEVQLRRHGRRAVSACVKEGLGLKHLRLIIGNSMGGMHAWMWGVKHPEMMDALVPMASQPTEMAARNWMMRRLLIETIRNDPDYTNGDYTKQPRSMKIANMHLRDRHQRRHARLAESRADRRRRPTNTSTTASPRRSTADANDYLYAWESRAATTRRRGWRKSRPPCWRSMRRTTSAIRPRPASPSCDEAHQERAHAADPAERGDARPRHHGVREVLCQGAARVPRSGAAARDVSALLHPLVKFEALPRPPATFGLVLTNSSAVSLSMVRVCASPSQFGKVLEVILNVTVFFSSSTV